MQRPLTDDELIEKLEALHRLKGTWVYRQAADRLRELRPELRGSDASAARGALEA